MTERERMAVLLYARVSDPRQGEKALSIPAQLRELHNHCQQHNWEVLKEFVDEGYSARTAKRSAFREAVQYALDHASEVGAIVTWAFNRFSRNRYDSVTIKDALRKRGIRVISITQPIPEGIEGELTEGILETIDAHQSRAIARDVIRGLREVTLQGFFPLTTAPIGYTRQLVRLGKARRYKLVPDKVIAPVVRSIFQLYVEGKGAKEVARALTKRGIAPPTGKWDQNKILRIIENPVYIGTLVIRFTTDTAMLLHPEQREVVKEDFCEPLVTREVFERAQAVREQRAREHPRHLASNYLLSGLLRCSGCGSKLIGVPARGARYHYYVCARRWNSGSDSCSVPYANQSRLDAAILDRVQNVLLCDENIRCLAKETDLALSVGRKGLDVERRVLERQIRDRERGLERLLDLIESGEEVPQAAWQRAKAREQEVTEDREKLAVLECRIQDARKATIEIREVIRYVTFLRVRLEDVPVDDQRRILKGFIRRIEVGKNEATIEYRLPTPRTPPYDLEEVLSKETSGTPGRI